VTRRFRVWPEGFPADSQVMQLVHVAGAEWRFHPPNFEQWFLRPPPPLNKQFVDKFRAFSWACSYAEEHGLCIENDSPGQTLTTGSLPSSTSPNFYPTTQPSSDLQTP